jgi:transcription initiation factor TFIIIB Brf1 subunit/transcription initiation factor TFIIB
MGCFRNSDPTLVNGLKEIRNMAVHINLPRMVVDRANCLFKNVYDCKNLKGHSTGVSFVLGTFQFSFSIILN